MFVGTIVIRLFTLHTPYIDVATYDNPAKIWPFIPDMELLDIPEVNFVLALSGSIQDNSYCRPQMSYRLFTHRSAKPHRVPTYSQETQHSFEVFGSRAIAMFHVTHPVPHNSSLSIRYSRHIKGLITYRSPLKTQALRCYRTCKLIQLCSSNSSTSKYLFSLPHHGQPRPTILARFRLGPFA